MKLLSLIAILSTATAFAPSMRQAPSSITVLRAEVADAVAEVADIVVEEPIVEAVAEPAETVEEEEVVAFIQPQHHEVVFGNLFTQKKGVAHVQGGSVVDYRHMRE